MRKCGCLGSTRKANIEIIDSCGDEHGDLFRLGRKGSRYFVEKIIPAFEPGAGTRKRYYKKSKKEAERIFDNACQE
jgi:hypothetical protein